jgi:hypothetical protein
LISALVVPLWGVVAHARLLAGATAIAAASVAWFIAVPQRISVTRHRLRWTALPFTRSIPLTRLEELDLDPDARVLARSDAASISLADGERHTAAHRRWLHARLRRAILDFTDPPSGR